MKSKYAPLVKLKKKGLDQAERNLIGANNALSAASVALNDAYTLLSTFDLPISGTVGELIQSKSIIQAQHYEIQRCADLLANAQQYQLQMQQYFKDARVEYEKFNYLAVQEAHAYTAKMKKEEAKMLDEIGVMTYKREIL
jgi:hypothetical protein